MFLCVQMKMQDLLRTDNMIKAKKHDAITPDDVHVEEQEGAQSKAGPSSPLKDADEGISSPLVVGNGPAAAGNTCFFAFSVCLQVSGNGSCPALLTFVDRC